MNYCVYKLKFTTGVHFGEGLLNQSSYIFRADSLFSALYIEAIKMECEKDLLEAVERKHLRFSDALPYKGDQYFVPKPMIYIENTDKGDSKQKKQYKKLKYIPVSRLNSYLQGDFELDCMQKFGVEDQNTKAAVRGKKESAPFHVGIYYFYPDSGLYVILSYENDAEKYLFEDLMNALSYTGIGGKKSSGLGKFDFLYGKYTDELERYLYKKDGKRMLLSSALPKEEELEQALEGASYLLEKRSGFVDSCQYADEQRRKEDLYVMAAGSCFINEFSGAIFDVSHEGNHSVYRYERPLFMGV